MKTKIKIFNILRPDKEQDQFAGLQLIRDKKCAIS